MALSLGKRGLGTASPNPMVGAILVKGKQIVGKGYHRRAGLPHAEVVAINDAKEEARGATLFINLEPCAHQGRTPPCVDTVMRAGIKKVVVSMLDPNPLVNGKGVETLRAGGVDTKVGLLEHEARRLNEAFITYMEKKRPFFTLKAAASLDGKIATKTCDSKWISNEESRRYVNKLRSVMDGVMVGINTVISDNPLLVPKVVKPRNIPIRIILDSKLRIPLSCDVVKTAEKYRTWIFTSDDSRHDKEARLKSLGVDVVKVGKDENGRVSLKHVCDALYNREVQNVLVEVGGELSSSLVREGLLEKCRRCDSPILIGGKNAQSLIGGKGIDFLRDAHKVDIVAVKRFKEDIFVEAYVHRDY